MSNMSVHFASGRRDWSTPDAFFKVLDDQFHFETDVCANIENTKCAHFFSEQDNCLVQDWGGKVCFMNPPYGKSEDPCPEDRSKCKKVKCQPHTYNCESNCSKHRGYHIDAYIPGIEDFIAKAYAESLKGATVVALLPSRTDTDWWHTYCVNAEQRFVRGRLNFDGHKNSAPFPSVVVVFYPPAVMRRAA